MTSGPSVQLVLERVGAIRKWRLLMGPTSTDTAKAEAPASLRALFGTDGTMNACHGSDAPGSAAREIGFFFPGSLEVTRTLALIKPHAVAAGHVDAIVREISAAGFTVVARERVQLTKGRAATFYAEHSGRAFFGPLCDMMSSGTMEALVLSKHAAVGSWRQMLGPTNSNKARKTDPLSMRGRFGVDGQKNACHGSDSAESAHREMKFFFPKLVAPGPVKEGAEAAEYLGSLLATPTKTLNQVLVDGLVELCKVKPTGLNAVRWLGEWLIKNNPTQPSVEGGSGVVGQVDDIVVAFPSNDAPTMPGAWGRTDGADGGEVKAGDRAVGGGGESKSAVNAGAIIELPAAAPMNVVFVLGGPGSGKGTQCARIVEEFGYTHLSTGDLLRAEVASGSAKGKEIEGIMATGGLVQLDTVLSLLKAAMDRSASSQFLVDGFPRELAQAFAFEKVIGVPQFVLFFDAPDEVLTERLLARGKSSGRVDDNSEAIVKRLAAFHEQSYPVVDFYGKLGKVRRISADRGIDDIFKEVRACFHPHAVVVLGGPGSGKGTMCAMLAAEFGYGVLSPGDLLRAEVALGTPLGEQVERLFENGQLVPDDMVIELLQKAMGRSPHFKFLIDGFPRNEAQAAMFESEVCPCDFVVHLDCDNGTMVRRCRESGRGRIDDELLAVRRRLRTWEEKTKPVIDLYEKAAMVKTVDASGAREHVYADVKRAFMPQVVFVLGGPGCGKGTQCAKIVAEFGYTHLSAGDLLRAEVARGSPDGQMIDSMIRNGQIVPVEVTLNLLKRAMAAAANDKFLIDGFPRAIDQAMAFEEQVGPCAFTLFLDCPEEIMRDRLLERGKSSGRVDDNEATIVKRFKVFQMQSMPVVNYFSRRGRVKMIAATDSADNHVRSRDEIYEQVRQCFAPEVVFVLGGPGSGKGTQCSNIVREFGYTHLSAGDLLRAEVARGSTDGVMIQEMMTLGKIVPVEVTLNLLKKAMDKNHATNKFLIDGFPRAIDQAVAFEEQVGPCAFTLFLDCPEDVMRSRLLERGKTSGRVDDNEATIVKRFRTFIEQSKPVVDRYHATGLVREVSSVGTREEVFAALKPHFQPSILLMACPEFPQKAKLCTRLCKELGCARLDAPSLMAEEAARGTADGQVVARALSRGSAVPTAVALRIIRKAVQASPASQFLLDGYPTMSSDGYPMVHDQIFAMDEGLSKCRHLLHIDVNPADLDADTHAAFRTETVPLVRFFASLGRAQTISVQEGVTDMEVVYLEMRAVAQMFLDPVQRGMFEVARLENEEGLEEARQLAAADAKDPEAPEEVNEDDE